jgi:hypothetical protein
MEEPEDYLCNRSSSFSVVDEDEDVKGIEKIPSSPEVFKAIDFNKCISTINVCYIPKNKIEVIEDIDSSLCTPHLDNSQHFSPQRKTISQ